MEENEDRSIAAYNSHTWVGHRSYIPGEPDNYDEYCSECGCTNLGDPVEFPDLEYPFCDEIGY